MRRLTLLILIAFAAGGCALRNEVVITPIMVFPSDVNTRAAGVIEAEEQGDYRRAIAAAGLVENRPAPRARELLALGSSEMAAGLWDDARRHLRSALDHGPSREEAGRIAWSLSQTEYLANNYAAALEWAKLARDRGLSIREWHLDYLGSLAETRIYEFPSRFASTMPMEMGEPEIPRLALRINDRREVRGIIDSGAVMSIVSETLAELSGVRSLGDYTGTFIGLLGEPINVRFGVIDSLGLGELEVRNVPVAIMADDQLDFVVYNREPFRMDFLLGANLLKEFRIELDYRHEVITFQPLLAATRVPDPAQNLFFVGFRPFVQTSINRKGWFLFILDTGSEITFLNQERIADTPVRRWVRYHGATLQGLGGVTKRGEKVEDVEIGVDAWGGKFKHIPLYSAQGEAYGILGQNFLKNFRVVLDFGSMRLDLYRDRAPFRRSAFDER
ncbi:MAG TPA: retroviral-like aspartic protease family protein [Thermoanaerobaculia bacterium]|nr:retroviral-like aspartic protease family protein [Thermoanaerobaculia bacterium]